jgi:hypothetical protein
MASVEALQIRTLRSLDDINAKLDAVVGGEKAVTGELTETSGPTLADVAAAVADLKTTVDGLAAVVNELVAKLDTGKAAKGKAS